jgi:hypothetical protein
MAASLGERAVWDCHTGGDDVDDGNVTAAALGSVLSSFDAVAGLEAIMCDSAAGH